VGFRCGKTRTLKKKRKNGEDSEKKGELRLFWEKKRGKIHRKNGNWEDPQRVKI